MWNRKNITIAFVVPFVIGGIVFSFFALAYMNSLAEPLKQPIDLAYAVFVSFLDMGTVCGVASVTCLNLVSKIAAIENSPEEEAH